MVLSVESIEDMNGLNAFSVLKDVSFWRGSASLLLSEPNIGHNPELLNLIRKNPKIHTPISKTLIIFWSTICIWEKEVNSALASYYKQAPMVMSCFFNHSSFKVFEFLFSLCFCYHMTLYLCAVRWKKTDENCYVTQQSSVWTNREPH
jgi:hypothetical protein